MMRKISMFSAFAGIFLVSGCATHGAITRAKATQSNVIVIATLDSRYYNGKAVSDNAGGLAGPLANLGGAHLGALGSAVVNLASGTAINETNEALLKDDPLVSVKFIFENTCGDWDYVPVSIRSSPDVLKLKSGSIVRLESGPGVWNVSLVRNAAGEPVYLSKSHPCYREWATEWKQNAQNVKRHVTWTVHKQTYFAPSLDGVEEPSFDYIQ